MNWKKYLIFWFKTSGLSFQAVISTRGASAIFIAGKLIRFFFFIWFLIILEDRIQQVAGYTLSQLILFFLVFNVFDLFGQLFFRGIYWFREDVVSGNFDFNLIKPINPLVQILTVHTDFLDLPLFFIVIAVLGKYIVALPLINLFAFAVVSISGIILVTAFHIFVAALGVITTEVDHTIMIYRDLTTMARFPIDIYTDAIRAILTFVIPIALVFTFPAKALLALLSLKWILFSIIFSLVIFWLSLKLWHYALTQYSSASS